MVFVQAVRVCVNGSDAVNCGLPEIRMNQMVDDTEQQQRPFFATPLGLVTAGGLMWLVACITAASAVAVLRNSSFESETAEVLMKYLFLTPSTLFGLLSMILLIVGSIRWAVYGRSSTGVSPSQNDDQVVELLKSINDRQLLSETTKRIAYRREDIEAIRRAIREDIEKRNFDAAMVLITELASVYGHREESEEFRDQLNAARMTEMEGKITRSLARIDEIISRHEFDQAAREAAKLQRLFAESDRVRNISKRVTEAREQYKRDLEREFLKATERDDVDRAMQLLREMDKYLTEQEAEPFRETARGVIGKARDNLGVQFKLAIQDREWLDAVRVGEQIIRDFPNTRMSDEVRDMLDLLRERAAGQQAAAPRRI